MNKAFMYILTFLLEPNDLEIFLNRAGVKWNEASEVVST